MKLEMNKNNAEWTSAQGCMPEGTTYQQLVEVFGEPNKDASESFKTDAEWFGTLDNETFTIYNYKTGHHYLGVKGKDVEDIIDWHIGGRGEDIAKKVIEYFEGKPKIELFLRELQATDTDDYNVIRDRVAAIVEEEEMEAAKATVLDLYEICSKIDEDIEGQYEAEDEDKPKKFNGFKSLDTPSDTDGTD